MKTLEYDQIITMVEEYAVSNEAKQKIQQMQPLLNEAKILALTKETTQARIIIDMMGNPPFAINKDIDMIVSLARLGGMLLPEQLTKIAMFTSTGRRVKEYLTKAICTKTDLAFYCDVLFPLKELSSEIMDAIRDNQVESTACKELREIRQKYEHTLENYLKEYEYSILISDVLQDCLDEKTGNATTINDVYFKYLKVKDSIQKLKK